MPRKLSLIRYYLDRMRNYRYNFKISLEKNLTECTIPAIIAYNIKVGRCYVTRAGLRFIRKHDR